MLGPHGRLGAEGSEQAAAIMAIVTRFSVISEGLATAPKHYAPTFERIDDGTVLAGLGCMGFLAAMQLRYAAWAALRDLTRIEHCGLLLPILPHCTDHAGRPLLPRSDRTPKPKRFLAMPITPSLSSCRQSTSSGCPSASKNSGADHAICCDPLPADTLWAPFLKLCGIMFGEEGASLRAARRSQRIRTSPDSISSAA